MNRLRHWSASLVSRVDWMVGMVENHEALAESAIRDLGRHAARAKVQMGRVRSDGQRLRPVSYTHLTLPTNREV